jgi:hypothetical protein
MQIHTQPLFSFSARKKNDQLIFLDHLLLRHTPDWVNNQIIHSKLSLSLHSEVANHSLFEIQTKWPKACIYPPTDKASIDVLFISNIPSLAKIITSDEISLILEWLPTHPKKYLCILLPFNKDRHRSKYLSYDTIPISIGNEYFLFQQKVIDTREYQKPAWSGEQVLLVYVAKDLIEETVPLLNKEEGNPNKSKFGDAAYSLAARLIFEFNNSLAKLSAQQLVYESQLRDMDFQIQEKEDEIIKLDSKIEMIKNSSIWRAMLPLRYVLDLIRATSFMRLLPGFVHKVKVALGTKSISILTFFQSLYGGGNQPIRRLNKKEFYTFLEKERSNYRGIFVQSGFIEWNIPLFQRPQHMARAMSKAGYLVIYLTTNVSRDRVRGFEEIETNLFLSNDLKLIYKITGAVVSFYSTCSGYKPYEIDRVRKKGNCIVYEYIDHIDPQISWSHVDKLQKLYDYVSRDTVDYALVSAKVLMDDMASKINPEQMIYVPNGVDYNHYTDALKLVKEEIPEDLVPLLKENKPIVGYFGAVAPWLWYELIQYCTDHCPDINFVVIGPDYLGCVDQLPRNNNFHYLGPIDYKILPTFAKHFTIGMIPFSRGSVAKSTSPLKLFEYFALRKPVVVTSDMYECIEFDEVLHAEDMAGFVVKLEEAIALSQDKQFTTILDKHARNNTWDKRALTVADVINPLTSGNKSPASLDPR